MKRMIAILLAVLTVAAMLTGCSGRDNTNVSTTPDGTVNGNNAETTTPNDQRPNTPNQGNDFQGAVIDPVDPTTDNNTTTDSGNANRPENGTTEKSPMENFGDDMTDAAEDIIDGTENAIDDAVGNNARARHSGTGMVGGR